MVKAINFNDADDLHKKLPISQTLPKMINLGSVQNSDYKAR
jgi:hypothetical protein